MSQIYPRDWKQCATCAYWQGEREPDYFLDRVTVNSSQEKGRCLCKRGWYNNTQPAGFCCNSYMLWEVLNQ